MIRVVIADDHPSIRLALKQVLEEEGDFEVVGEAADGAEAVRAVAETRPQLVVLDYRMPRGNGLEAARAILQESPGITLVMMTGEEDPAIETEAAEAGVSSYLVKTGMPAEIVGALREAAGAH